MQTGSRSARGYHGATGRDGRSWPARAGGGEASWPARQDLPEAQTGFAFRLLGLVGLSDPLRASVPAAVADCQAAGVRVVMITGDHPVTARAIAAEAGLPGDVVLTGNDLTAMSDDDLA
ncbi:MAG: HAD family hydrolase, partial [Allgaiera sp.]|nr:HAD family hydrolase [Allgaiera sp.]